MTWRIGMLGGRGHVGRELLSLLDDRFELVALGTRDAQKAGRTLAESWLAPVEDPTPPSLPAQLSDMRFSSITPDHIADLAVDAWVLGLGNGESAPYIAALQQSSAVLLDLSADHRFDDAWVYGLPELNRDAITSARRIANPGCYATALALAVLPYRSIMARTPYGFGVSGYSGAGATPSPRNDPAHLANNLLPYALVNHVHEQEVSRHLATEVRLLPHVAPFFRGITMTVAMTLREPLRAESMHELAAVRYRDEPLVRVQRHLCEVRDAAGRDDATLSGFATDGDQAVVVATLDNLRKGAATQALQNLQLALTPVS